MLKQVSVRSFRCHFMSLSCLPEQAEGLSSLVWCFMSCSYLLDRRCRSAISLLVLPALVGCATSYVPPDSGPVAWLEFSAPQMAVPAADRPRTVFSIYVPNRRGCLIPARVTGSGFPRVAVVQAAGQPVIVNYEHFFSPNRRDTFTCSGWAAFRAEEGTAYVAQTSLHFKFVERSVVTQLLGGAVQASDYTCGLSMGRKTGDVLAPVFLERPQTTMQAGFGGCLKLDLQD